MRERRTRAGGNGGCADGETTPTPAAAVASAAIFWDLDNVKTADNAGPEAAKAQLRLFQALVCASGVPLTRCVAFCNFSTLVSMSAHEVNALLDGGCDVVVTPVLPQSADDAIMEAVGAFSAQRVVQAEAVRARTHSCLLQKPH